MPLNKSFALKKAVISGAEELREQEAKNEEVKNRHFTLNYDEFSLKKKGKSYLLCFYVFGDQDPNEFGSCILAIKETSLKEVLVLALEKGVDFAISVCYPGDCSFTFEEECIWVDGCPYTFDIIRVENQTTNTLKFTLSAIEQNSRTELSFTLRLSDVVSDLMSLIAI